MSSETKQIVLVIPSMQAGGMQRVMSELAWHFCAKPDVKVHLILYGKSPEAFYSLPETLEIHKPSFIFNDRYRLLSSLRRLIYLRAKIKSIKPYTVLSFGEYWNSFVLIAMLGLRYPVFISDRGSPMIKYNRIHSALRKFLYPRASGIIAQTSKAKEILSSQLHHNNIKVIGNPVRKLEFSESFTEKENIVLTVGRLIRSKNHDKLIDAFLSLNIPKWKLIIAGDDALKESNMVRLQKLVKERGASEIVSLAGLSEDIDQLLHKSKIFAFTSSSEGYPNVLVEALAAGLPVVAFDCIAGPSEIINNEENGFLVPLHDYYLFSNRLRLLMENEDMRERFSESALQKGEKLLMENNAEKYYQFIIE